MINLSYFHYDLVKNLSTAEVKVQCFVRFLSLNTAVSQDTSFFQPRNREFQILSNKRILQIREKLSMTLGKFGDKVSALKLPCCQGQLASFPRVTFRGLTSFNW